MADDDTALYELEFGVEISTRYHDSRRASLELMARFLPFLASKARTHETLYRRFKALQIEIAKHKERWRDHINAWTAEAQSIRLDEPPVLWAIYTGVWNEALERRRIERGEFRRVTLMQSIFGRIYHYRPKDFPKRARSSVG